MARTKKDLEAENDELRELLGDVYDRVAAYLEAGPGDITTADKNGDDDDDDDEGVDD